VDSTGLKLCGAGEWLIEKHGTRTRRSWRKFHIAMDAETGEIVAAELTTNDVDDASGVGPLRGQMAGPVASFTGDGADDQDDVSDMRAHESREGRQDRRCSGLASCFRCRSAAPVPPSSVHWDVSPA
jgi:hypothetical protein